MLRRARHDLPLRLAALGLLAALGAVAWLSRHPDSPTVTAIAGWPVLGGAVGRLRATFLPPPPPPPAAPAGEAPPEVLWTIVWQPPVGTRRTSSEAAAEPETSSPDLPTGPIAAREWARPGALLQEGPSTGDAVREELRGWTLLPVIERRPGWAGVWRSGRLSWIRESALSADDERPLGSAPEPPRPLPSRAADPLVVATARDLLGPGGRETALAGYRLLTDLGGDPEVERLARAAGSLEPAYRERTGLAPLGAPAETVVLFAREAAYRDFQGREERLAGLPAAGHAGGGHVALFAGDRDPDEVVATLLHEIGHLLNRRALGPALPAWLDEGLAEDLAQTTLDGAGAVVPGSLGGRAELGAGRLVLSGGRAAAVELARAFGEGRALSLSELLAADWERFVGGDRGAVNYAHALFLVRYLCDGEGGALAPAWRDFLAGVARGEPPAAERLLARLGRGWPELEAGLRGFVAGQRAAALAVTAGAPP